MNTLIVYFSKFGHTRRVAEEMGRAISSYGGSTRLIGAEELVSAAFEGVDLIIMGSPTHKMNLPEAVRPVLEKLPRRCLQGKQVAAFDTSYKMNWLLARFTAAPRLNRRLRKLGGKSVAQPETFFVVAREGPLFEGELERAGQWAVALVARPENELAMEIA